MVYGSGEHKPGQEIIFQSAPDSWSELIPNHHSSKIFIAHQSTGIDNLILNIVCTFSTGAGLGETLFITSYP